MPDPVGMSRSLFKMEEICAAPNGSAGTHVFPHLATTNAQVNGFAGVEVPVFEFGEEGTATIVAFIPQPAARTP